MTEPTGCALLAVDDERPALEDLVRMLRGARRSSRAVDGAASAAEALRRARRGRRRYDGAVPRRAHARARRARARARAAPLRAAAGDRVRVSAFDDAAVDAFELAALDYLVKPVSRAAARRGDRARPRAPRRRARRRPTELDADVLPVDTLRGGGTRLLARSSILYLQAHGDYVRVVVRRRALPAARAAWPTSRRAGRATASRACTAATSSTCAARSRSARSSTAPPCW